MEKTKKSMGIGSISIILVMIGVIWIASYKGLCLGDIILNGMGLKSWSNKTTGIHYTVFYSLLFFVPAFSISTKYPNCYFAKTSKIVSLVFGAIIILSVFLISF